MVSVRLLRLVSYYQLAALTLLVAATAFVSPSMALSELLGGLLMALNFGLLRFLAARALGGPGSTSQRVVYAIALGTKLVAVMGVMTALVLIAQLDSIGIALGLGTLFPGIAGAIVHEGHKRTTSAPDAAVTAPTTTGV